MEVDEEEKRGNPSENGKKTYWTLPEIAPGTTSKIQLREEAGGKDDENKRQPNKTFRADSWGLYRPP